jgi:RNA-directed DNA polymerase
MGTNLGDPTDQVEPNSTEKCITLLRTGRESVRIVVVTKRGNARGAKDPYHKHALNNNLEADCQMAVTETKVRLPEEEWEALKVQRLRTKLADKAKREPKFRFYILYEHIKRMDVLKLAWKEVKKNAGGPGVDNVCIKDFDNEGKVSQLLETIQRELHEETYIPQPVKRVFIPKPNGKLRPLGIPTVKDRIVQAAARMVIEPIFEVDFQNCSYGFRPNRSAHQALEKIQEHIKSGRTAVYDADLKAYFDTIPHNKLMACLRMRISDRKVLRLIKMWLRAPVSEETFKGRGPKLTYPKQGTPQGGVISPLLANIYLHWFDKVFHDKDGPVQWANATLVRYADDFVILAKYQGCQIQEFVEDRIERWLGLEINREKTRIVNLKEGGSFDFLGYTFRYKNDLLGRPWKYLCMEPSKKAIQKEKDAIKEGTNRKWNWMPIPEMVKKLNRQLGGWGNYFSVGYPRKARRQINCFVRERLTKHLQKRSQRRYRPSEGTSFYATFEKLGLKYL